MSLAALSGFVASLALARAALPPVESCAGPLGFYIDAITASGSKEAYLCLAVREEARDTLRTTLEGMAEDAGERGQVSRALAIHLMQRVDRPFTAEEARALNPDDRRLLIDAIHGHHGRKTPAPEHAQVLENFDWYQPDAGYTRGRLTELDLENIQLLEKPPEPEPPPKEEPAAAAMAEARAAETPSSAETWCGCGAATAPAGGLVAAFAALFATRRRGRRTQI